MHHLHDKARISGAYPGGIRIALRLLGARQRFSFVLLIIGRIGVGFCDLGVAASMYVLFLLLQARSPAHHLWWLPKTTLSAAMITSILVALRVLMDLSSARAVMRRIFRLYSDLLIRLTQGYNEMQWRRFVSCNRSVLSNHALLTAREAAEFYRRLIDLAAAVAVVIVMAAAIVYQSPIAACGFCAALAAFFAFHRFFIRSRIQIAAATREESLRMLQKNLADLFSSSKEIRTYRNQAFFHERIRKHAERMALSNIRITFLPQAGSSLADQGAVLLFLCIIIAVQFHHGDARQALSLLAFYFVLSRRLIPLISQISLNSGQLESSFDSVRRVDDELNKCRSYRDLPAPVQLPDSGFVLQLKEVSFSFCTGTPVLRNLNLVQREAEVIVLHGPSGIGKSSLLNLIAGVSQPSRGIIRVDRTRIGYVPQEVALLDDSIRNNLLFGLDERSDAELMSALATAKLDDFVMAQPFGLETNVGDNGALFSGGQRQRLGLARAVLRGSQFLLLDEATSALDEESEWQILENLRASGKAVLLVTHRMVLRMLAQRVFRLEEGYLIEEYSGGALTQSKAAVVRAEC
jgi:ABC-type multidrug transport system fused ATPase/permease subunit